MKVYVAQTHEDGILGAGATPEVGKRIAEEKIDDYFGKPIQWRLWNEGTEAEHWSGTFNQEAHLPGIVWLERVEVRSE